MIQTNTKTVLLLCALMAGTTSMRADDENQMVESRTSFSVSSNNEACGKLQQDITWTAYKGSGTADPYFYKKHIRLYHKSKSTDKYGGYITLSAPVGFKITNFTITTTDTYAKTKVTYTVDESTNLNNATASLAKNSNYIINNLNNQTVSIFCVASNSDSDYSTNNLEIGSISVTYVGEGTVSVASACTDGTKYYSTYSNSHAFVVPNGLTVSEIAVDNGKLIVSDYKKGDIVPANTGVMVSSETYGTKSINFTGVISTSVLGSSNCLRPSGDAGITAAEMLSADGGCKFYRLTMHNGTQIGYWWGAADGGAFSVAANKAYLAVPEDELTSRSGFSLFGEETAIGQLLSDSQTSEKTLDCYDLQGRKVTNSKLQKGLYIVNGRKVIRQ